MRSSDLLFCVGNPPFAISPTTRRAVADGAFKFAAGEFIRNFADDLCKEKPFKPLEKLLHARDCIRGAMLVP